MRFHVKCAKIKAYSAGDGFRSTVRCFAGSSLIDVVTDTLTKLLEAPGELPSRVAVEVADIDVEVVEAPRV